MCRRTSTSGYLIIIRAALIVTVRKQYTSNHPVLLANNYFRTTFRRAHCERQARPEHREALWDVGTVGAVVLDSLGHLAASGSTGEITEGRIGDTAVLRAGLYANSRVGVVW